MSVPDYQTGATQKGTVPFSRLPDLSCAYEQDGEYFDGWVESD